MLYRKYNFGFFILQTFLIWLTISSDFILMITTLFLVHLNVYLITFNPIIMLIYSAAPLVI